jgi:hypothetical protein
LTLTRSTVDEGARDLGLEALADLLHWVWAWRLQLSRLVESTRSQGAGETGLEQRKSLSQASLDEHLVAFVGKNLVKSVERASSQYPDLPSVDSGALGLLRDLYEHWDEQRAVYQDSSLAKKRSAKKLADGYPSATPWSISYTADDWLLGGVVSLRQLTADLEPVEAKALQLETEHGGSER